MDTNNLQPKKKKKNWLQIIIYNGRSVTSLPTTEYRPH